MHTLRELIEENADAKAMCELLLLVALHPPGVPLTAATRADLQAFSDRAILEGVDVIGIRESAGRS